jgi:hypothetical protein
VLAVSELYIQLAISSADWKLNAYDTEPVCWRSFTGPGGRPLNLKPDAFIVGLSTEYQDSYFLELDRGTEPLTRISDKARSYINYWQSGREQATEGVFPLVLFVTTTKDRAEQIVEMFARLDAEHWQLFAVTTTARAETFITNPTHLRGGEQT